MIDISLYKFLIFCFFLSFLGCQNTSFVAGDWIYEHPGIGSSSSPRAIDLDGDSILDIVLGGGAKEFTPTESGVIAINGATGELLWQAPARNQIVGSPVFQDINEDGTADVFIGGRSAIMYALNGKDGSVIWEYLSDNDSTDYYTDSTILNFYTPQLILDVDNDGIKDILTAYGGFIKAQEGDLERPIGSLMIMSGKTGKVISRAYVPDGKEIYCSPVIIEGSTLEETMVVFGTGGEYINGHLFKTNLMSILSGDLENAVILADGEGKGFIAPPIIVDVNLDSQLDIIALSVVGRLFAIDGSTNEELWKSKAIDDLDTYAMPAVGLLYGEDSIPDYFISLGKGAWPDTEYTIHCLINGKNGVNVLQDTFGTFQYASSTVADINNNGKQEVILSINTEVKSELYRSHMKFLGTELVVYPLNGDTTYVLGSTKLGTNLGSTPLWTDLDGDDKIDVISIYMGDPLKFYSFTNLIVSRQELDLSVSNIAWGGYMGADGTSKFK